MQLPQMPLSLPSKHRTPAAPFLGLTLSLVLGLLVMGCDVIEKPYTENPTPTNPIDTASVVQNVLVEDYTGYYCGNCPSAGDKLKELNTLYGNRVVPIAIHAGFFARPRPEHPLDLRSQTGDELDAYFKVSEAGNPNGLVNRQPWNDRLVVSHNNWAAAAANYLQQAPTAGITLQTSYNPTSRQLTVDASVRFVAADDGPQHLALYLVEDSIIGYQKDYRIDRNENPAQANPTYKHDHVLRAAINSVWGDEVASSPTPGTTWQDQYTYTVPTEWRAEHLQVVAVLHHHPTRTVTQAAQHAAID